VPPAQARGLPYPLIKRTNRTHNRQYEAVHTRIKNKARQLVGPLSLRRAKKRFYEMLLADKAHTDTHLRRLVCE